jgi:hypothetical protein
VIAGLPDNYGRTNTIYGGNPASCWAVFEKVHLWGEKKGETYIIDCHTLVDLEDTLGLCPAHRQEILPVRLEPCPTFRPPLEGDLFCCADCGHWTEEHAT